MDEYSKSGPKSPTAASRNREREQRQLLQQLLDIDDEQDFIEELWRHFRIGQRDSGFKQALTIWREKRRAR